MISVGFMINVPQKLLRRRILQECFTPYKKFHQQHILKATVRRNVGVNEITSNAKFLSHVPNTKPQTEQDFLVQLKNDPDTFGNADEQEHFDEGDLREEKHFEQPLPSQKLSTKRYADIIKRFIKKRKIKEAIDVLEVKMIKEDKVKPENYIYNLLLGACGRVGYTKKAFSLYNQMKKRGLKVTGGTYTALFNACSNSPWPEDGLTRAHHLRNIMIEKLYEPNETNYNAMIKAFGRCGDLSTSFALVDEMITKRMCIKDDTMNFLLQACIQDKQAGFRHALLVWRKMMIKRIAPSYYTYNLMLRCIRDCGIGDVKVMNDTLNILLKNTTLPGNITDSKLLLQSSKSGKLLQNFENSSNENVYDILERKSDVVTLENNMIATDSCRPNLMAKAPTMGNIISFTEISKPEDRLLLVGGFKGYLSNMSENNCFPDIKTFTQLLDCLPGNINAEQELQRIMKKLNVKPDIDFFNMLIKKRSMRFDYDSAKAVVNDMKIYKYRPNLITFGVLSLGCKTREEALELINEMKEHSYILNTEILGTMLHQACYHTNFSYVLEIMELTIKENVKPNKIFMQHLQDFKKTCKNISNDKENKLSERISFQKGFRIFQMRYKTWLEEVEIDDSEDVHPWTQYRHKTETDTRHYKDKSQRFKPRHTSRFKVKTSAKSK